MSLTAVRTAGKGRFTKPRYEVADVFQKYGQIYRNNHCLPLSHLKVMRSIETCRTDELGGHLERCCQCGHERNAYNSCRNRHCPKCQALAKAKWLEDRKAELLPVNYFHNVFTIPHELNPIILCNKKVIYDILFRSVADTLQEFAADPKHGLGGKLGFTAILHTWDQKLLDHTHLHCLIPAGVLSPDNNSWIKSRDNFLFSVRAMSRVFRGKFMESLKSAFSNKMLIFPGHIAKLENDFSKITNQLWKKNWVVYSKAPFQGPGKVLDYLGRYTHRVAIANHRIIKVEDGLVAFQYRDRRDNDKSKQITINAQEFIHRFLLHVLPNGYKKIRHFGFLASRCKKQNLAKCRKILGVLEDLPEPQPETFQEKMLRLTAIDITLCPKCKNGQMKKVKKLISAWELHLKKVTIVSNFFDSS